MTDAEERATLFPTVGRLRREGRVEEASRVLRDALRRGRLGPGDVERAGRVLQGVFQRAPCPEALRVRVLGQVTTAWIPPVLTAVAWGRGMALVVTDGGYDNVLQEVGAEPGGAVASGDSAAPEVLVLIPSAQRLLAGGDAAGELAYWEAVWARRGGARVVQVGYDLAGPGPLGVALSGAPGGSLRRIHEMNATLRERLPTGAAWVDLERIAGDLGRRVFYDPRQQHWTRQPWSEAGLVELCRHLHAAIRACTRGPRKVLVLDLDNTLWGGVVGEVGAPGIVVRETPDGEAFRAFQVHCRGLAERGVVLAVASKNNPEDAREPFTENPDMVLRLGDFAAFEASWQPKAQALARISETLRLGLDSFVFFDDNPAEREHIRQALPEVEVVEVPEEPAGYVRALEEGLWFEAVALTAEDAARAGQYQEEGARRSAAHAFESLDAWLVSLQMRAQVAPVTEEDLERVVQLLGKTNQFNLTTRRHGVDQVRAMLAEPGVVALTVRVQDRYGDHGLVAVVIGVPGGGATIRVDTWLMSCRVIGRTVEHHTWCAFLNAARARGYTHVEGEYIPTAKNTQVADLYASLGLARVGDRYVAEIAALAMPRSFVEGGSR